MRAGGHPIYLFSNCVRCFLPSVFSPLTGLTNSKKSDDLERTFRLVWNKSPLLQKQSMDAQASAGSLRVMHEILFECVQSRLQISKCRLCIGHCSCVPLKHLMQECKAFVFLLFKFWKNFTASFRFQFPIHGLMAPTYVNLILKWQ